MRCIYTVLANPMYVHLPWGPQWWLLLQCKEDSKHPPFLLFRTFNLDLSSSQDAHLSAMCLFFFVLFN